MNRFWIAVFGVVLGVAGGLARGEAVDLVTCTEESGRQVPGEADETLKVLVKPSLKGGKRVILYNPDLMPGLSAMARQFFYAQACARVALDGRAGSARAADCAAAEMLRAGGFLGEGGDPMARLKAELAFSDETWAQLPGPRRSFDFDKCSPAGGLRLPEVKPATPQQREWDGCVRQCGDGLYRCAGKGTGAGCQETYDRCHAACGG